MVPALLTGVVLVELCVAIALHAWRKTGDAFILPIMIGATLARLVIGIYDVTGPPLPGATVDAVFYEMRAFQFATTFDLSGHFVFEVGREAYSSLLSIPYIFGGRVPVFVLLVNLAFTLSFLGLVYQIAASLGGRRRARAAVAIAAFYPTSLFYTAVPLRECVLMWAIALWLHGLLRFLRGRSHAFGWRTILGAAVATWLNIGFGGMAVLIPLVWALRSNDIRARFTLPAGRTVRLAISLVFVTAIVAGFLAVGKQIPKVPNNPAQIINPTYINQIRGTKASEAHGATGYAGGSPTSLGRFILALPLLDVRFLITPLPTVPAGGAQLLSALDGVIAGMLCCAAVLMSVRRIRAGGPAADAWLLVGTILVLVTTFAIGTANAGIAVRHRSDFAWLFAAVICAYGSWSPASARVFRLALDGGRVRPAR